MSLVMPQAPVTRLERLEKCSTCKAMWYGPDGRALECHAEPVRSTVVAGPNGAPVPMSYFPQVLPDWGCLQWKPRIETGKPS